MGSLTDADKDRLRSNGVSEQEISYYDAENQKDYEPLLKDPNTSSELLLRMVDMITNIPLKKLALMNPNIPEKSQNYILDKADKKPYYKELVETFFAGPKKLTELHWIRLRKHFNIAGRLDLAVIELMESQSSAFSTDKLDIIFNTFADTGIKSTKIAERYLLAIFEHKNFNVSILDGKFFKLPYIFHNTDVLNAIGATKNNDVIFVKLYELTGDADWLPTAVKDIFLF